MIQYQKHSSTSLDLRQVLLTHKRPMVWTFSAIMLIAIAATFLGPKTYTSEAKLFVRLGRESVAIDPTAAAVADNVVMVHESREFEINSVFELLKSREVLANVVSAVGPQVVLGEGPGDDKAQTAGMFDSLNVFSPYSVDDEALKKLAKDLSVAAVKKSNVINIWYEAKSPELARDIVAKVIDQARDAHMRVNRTGGSHEFFAAQTNQLRDKLVRLETQLRDLKNASGIASLPDQRQLKLQQIAELQSSLLKIEATLTAATAEMEAQKGLLGKIPEKISTSETTGMPQSTTSALREQFFLLQVREKELLSMYTPKHPHAVAIREQVDALKAVLDAEPDVPQLATGPNQAHQEIHLSHLKGEASTASLKAHCAALREQLAPVQDELKELNNNEAEITRLQREVEMVSANYKKYSENLEQARIDHELEMKNISNLNVLQPPTYSITPTRPKRFLNLALGLVAALASSLGVGLFLEQRRSGLVYRLLWPSQPTAPADHSALSANGHHERGSLETPWNGSSAGEVDPNLNS